jgi:hypothetical protein
MTKAAKAGEEERRKQKRKEKGQGRGSMPMAADGEWRKRMRTE